MSYYKTEVLAETYEIGLDFSGGETLEEIIQRLQELKEIHGKDAILHVFQDYDDVVVSQLVRKVVDTNYVLEQLKKSRESVEYYNSMLTDIIPGSNTYNIYLRKLEEENIKRRNLEQVLL